MKTMKATKKVWIIDMHWQGHFFAHKVNEKAAKSSNLKYWSTRTECEDAIINIWIDNPYQ